MPRCYHVATDVDGITESLQSEVSSPRRVPDDLGVMAVLS